MANSNDHNRDVQLVQRLSQIVRDNFGNEQFGVSELARVFGISRSQLHKKLKKTAGKSVSQFIREIRLEEAMSLLQKDAASVSEIAYQVGFSSPAYFNTCFKNLYGFPPGEAKVRAEVRSDFSMPLPLDKTEVRTANRPSKKQVIVALLATGVLFIVITASYIFWNNQNRQESITSRAIVDQDVESRRTTIAVLPLKNWSGDSDLEYISDGMTDAIITNLSKVNSVEKVVPFTSMLAYKHTQKSISEIAKELNVNNILQGNFQLSGEVVNINLQLIDAANENQLWDNEYKGAWNTSEIFKMQSEVVENVVAVMQVELTEFEIVNLQKIPTQNKEAYNLFLLAKHQMGKGNEIAFGNAIPLYEKAIKLDPKFTDAYVGLAEIWIHGGLIWGIYDENTAWNNAKSLLETAVILDSTNINISDELHRGYFYFDWDMAKVETYLENRKKIPGFDVNKYASFTDYFRKTGRFSEMLVIDNQNIVFNPLESWGYISKAWELYYLNRNDESFDVISSYSSMFVDDLDYLREAAKLYYYLGADEKSKEQVSLIMSNFPDRPPIIIWLSAIHGQIDGNEAITIEHLDKLLEMYNKQASGSPAWFIALYYCHIKDYDKAFEWLQKSYNQHEVEMLWIKEEPLLRPLKNDPRYLELYEKVGFSKLEV
jgi:TolB-like protein/AraC-like DNA-binding protein